MSAMEIYKMITKLIRLTKTDKIFWRKVFSLQYANYKTFKFFVEYPRDERPRFTVNGFTTQEYNVSTEILLREINRQYRRRKMYCYSDEETAARKTQEESDEQKRKRRAEDLKTTANNFLKSFGKNRGRKKRNW